MTDHTDTYSLAGGRACVLTYPPDLSADEVDGITDWLTLIVWKLGRIATPHAVRDALRIAELADTDAHLADANARCARLKGERDALEANFAAFRASSADEAHALRAAHAELQTELAHQRKLVETLCERVAAQSELLSQRAAKPVVPVVIDDCGAASWPSAPPAPKVVVLDDPEADLPEFFVEQPADLPAVLPVPTEPYPSAPAVVDRPAYPVLDPAKVQAAEEAHDRAGVPAAGAAEVFAALLAPQTYRDDKEHVPPCERHGNSPKPEANTRKRVNRGRATRIKIAAALVAKPLTAAELHAATGIPQGTLSDTLPIAVHGWWTKRFHHRGSPYEITDKGRAALRAEGIDAPDPPAPKGIDRDRERCRLIAEEMVKLVAPHASVTLAAATGLEWDDVEKYLRTRPEWFAKVESGGYYYRLTAQGRALAEEKEAV